MDPSNRGDSLSFSHVLVVPRITLLPHAPVIRDQPSHHLHIPAIRPARLLADAAMMYHPERMRNTPYRRSASAPMSLSASGTFFPQFHPQAITPPLPAEASFRIMCGHVKSHHIALHCIGLQGMAKHGMAWRGVASPCLALPCLASLGLACTKTGNSGSINEIYRSPEDVPRGQASTKRKQEVEVAMRKCTPPTHA